MKFNIKKDAIRDKGAEAASKKLYAHECPHCHRMLNIPVGKSICPFCRGEIELSLNVHF